MKKNWVELYKKYGIYILLVVVFAFFAVAAPNFLAAKNVINILRQVSMFGIVVVGVCMVMIGGGMDLSVGMQMAVDGMLIGYMMVNLNVPIPLAVIITIVVGCLLGAANGIIAVKMHIAPIIVTLGTMLVLQGVAYLITGGYPITGMPEAFKVIGQGYVGIIPVPVIIFVLFIIFGAILMNKTYLGRYIYALGGNKEAARLAGINVDKLTVAVYTFCGFCASIAALIMVGRTNAAQPGAGEVKAIDWKKMVTDADLAVKIIDRQIEERKIDIKGAGIIVAGGYGMGSKENFRLVHELADVLGGEVGASRAAVDAGFTEHARQVGQTGVTVRPKLYIACGISGQIQHTAGMDQSSMVISINSDPEAPINKIADYAITGDVNEIIPKMIKYYKQNSK